jgi:hypothetical protein
MRDVSWGPLLQLTRDRHAGRGSAAVLGIWENVTLAAGKLERVLGAMAAREVAKVKRR